MKHGGLIVFAEKSRTEGTNVAFRQLFQIDFRPGQNEYNVNVHQKNKILYYVSLADTKNNPEYCERFKSFVRDRNIESVICFEFCNPRIQEIDGNIHELKELLGCGITDKTQFVFYSTGHETQTRDSLVRQMREFAECDYIPNLEQKVSLICNFI